MHTILSTFLGAALLAVAVPAHAVNVSIAFAQPGTYADAGYSRALPSARERAESQRDIAQHLQRLAEHSLAGDESLAIEVLDIDLAGRFEPLRTSSGANVRIVRDITWPRIKLRYTLTRSDQLVVSAEEELSDMNYLASVNRYWSADRLRYEKAMLDDWFEKRIGKR